MAPRTRKRKADAEAADAQPRSDNEDRGPNVIGGLNGDYRVTGDETSDSYESFTVTSQDGKDIPCQKWQYNGSGKARTTLIFTHGAGGGLNNPATKLFAEGYASKGSIICFQGTMNLKSRLKSFQNVLDHLQDQDSKQKFAVGGRSMGARAAVMLAQSNEAIKSLVLVSYPLTSPKGDLRDEILLELPEDKRVLFVTGSNDNMCETGELQKVAKKMKATSVIRVVEGADHGMSLSKVPQGQNKAETVEKVRRISGEEAADWVADKLNFKNLSSLDLVKAQTPEAEPKPDKDQDSGQSTQKKGATQREKSVKKRKKG